MPPHPRLRRLLLRSLALALGVGLVGSVEAIVRLGLPRLPPILALVSGTGDAMRSEAGRELFEANVHLGWQLRRGARDVLWQETLVSTGPRGLRTFGTPVPSAALRILCLGDSVTFGYKVPRVHPDRPTRFRRSARPYPFLIERWLEQQTGQTVEVLDMAVPGYTSFHGLRWLGETIDELAPQLVIVNYGYNDTFPVPRPYRVTYSPSWLAVAGRHLKTKSQAALRLDRWLRTLPSTAERPSAALQPAVSPTDYLANIAAIVDLAHTHGARALVVGQVYQWMDPASPRDVQMAENRAALREATARQGTPYLEIPELIGTEQPAEADLFVDPIHPGFRGHRLMAEAILRKIEDEQLLASAR